MDCMCIPSCCKNKDNAELFINFMCDAEVAAANAGYIYYGTPNKAALELMDEDYIESELVNPPEEFMEKCYTFTNLDNRTYSLMQENFIKACTGKSDTFGKVSVAVLLGLILLLTVVVVIFNIRRAIQNRGRINKI